MPTTLDSAMLGTGTSHTLERQYVAWNCFVYEVNLDIIVWNRCANLVNSRPGRLESHNLARNMRIADRSLRR